tara:strand:- start:137 stop:910 length:774 start_codon:yes stop_codon:yes gene_type:complete
MIKIIRFLVKIEIFKRLVPSLIKKIFQIFKIKNIIIKKKDILLKLNLNNPIDRQIFFKDNYEEEQIKKLETLIKKFNIKIFIDIGAHMGIYSMLMSKQDIKVHAFEPFKENFEQLEVNKKINNLYNLSIYNQALSDKSNEITMWVSDKNKTGGMSIFDNNDEELFKYDQNKLIKAKSKSVIGDEVFNMVNEYLAIKIDVERHEHKVLIGLNKLLQNNFVIIQIELFDERKKDIFEYLQELNFKNFDCINKDFYFKNF